MSALQSLDIPDLDLASIFPDHACHGLSMLHYLTCYFNSVFTVLCTVFMPPI